MKIEPIQVPIELIWDSNASERLRQAMTDRLVEAIQRRNDQLMVGQLAQVPEKEWQEFKAKAVRCPQCRWTGTIADCDPAPDEVVYCPVCCKAVELDEKRIQFREFL